MDVTGAESFVDTGPGMFSPGSDVLPQDIAPAVAGHAIVRWDDQSGLNNHATQSNAALRATLLANVANWHPVLRFAADGGYATPLVLNKPCTVFVVYSYTSAASTARRTVQGSTNWLLGPYSLKHDFFNGTGFTNGPAVVQGRFVAQAAWQNGTASRNFVNGSFVGSTLGAGGNPGTFGLGTSGAFFEGLVGDIAEVIAYDSALSDLNLANVWNYLTAKFALS